MIQEGVTPQTLLSKAIAAARARELARPDAIFNDPLAEVLAGDDGRALLERLDALHPGDPAAANPLAVRACFLDEFLYDAVNAEGGPRQVVILGAGMDTRAFRLYWPEGTTVYEVDDAETLADKQRLLDGAGSTPTAKRVTVAGTLGGAWTEALVASGFDRLAASLWVLEGVLIGLDETGVNHTLHAVSQLASPSSGLALDVLGKETLAMPPLRPVLDLLDEMGVRWRFGTDEPEALLGLYGFGEVKVTQAGDAAGRYLRAELEMPPREVPGVPREFYVTARRR